MNKNSTSNNMMVLAVSVVIAFVCFFFGFMKMNTKSDELDTKIASVDTLINQRKEYKSNSEQYEKDTEKFVEDKTVYLDKFPSKVIAEDITALARDIKRLDDGKDDTVGIDIVGAKITAAEEAYSSKDSQIIGYVVSVTYDVDYCSYKGIKKIIDYINSYDNRCNVVSYDVSMGTTQEVKVDESFNATKQINGSIDFNMYFALGTDEERYTAPTTEKYTYSVEDPFAINLFDVANNFMEFSNSKDGSKVNIGGTNTSGTAANNGNKTGTGN